MFRIDDEYAPREDTFFLIDLLKDVKGNRALEIGCGSGFILEQYSQKKKGLFVGIDIMLKGLLKCKRRHELEFIHADGRRLPFRSNSFDVVFFNPPYLPSEKVSDLTIDGGKDGIEITLEFLRSSREVLRPSGLVIFISSTLSNLEKLEEKLLDLGFKIIKKEERGLFFERLVGYYLMRKSQ